LDQRTAEKVTGPRKARLWFRSAAAWMFLGLFMWGTHGIRVDDPDQPTMAMWWVTKMFEGQFIPGQKLSYSGIVAAVVALVAVHFVASTACSPCRKFPANFQEYKKASPANRQCLRHEDTTLWWVQAWTRLCASFLFPGVGSSVPMLMHPGGYWPLRIAGARVERPLVAAVSDSFVCRGAAWWRRPYYRLAVKWGAWFEGGDDPEADAPRCSSDSKWAITNIFPDAGIADIGGGT